MKTSEPNPAPGTTGLHRADSFHLDERPDLARALHGMLDSGLRVRMAEAADGSPCVRCVPAHALTDDVRHVLREHGRLVRHVLTEWGDSYGFLLLCALWAGDVPREPFTLRSGVRVTDSEPFMRELRRAALTGSAHARVRTGGFVADVADLVWRPGFLRKRTPDADAA